MATADPAATPAPTSSSRTRTTTTDLALIAAFAALIVACTLVASIPVGAAGVPITLQTFGVLLAGCLLGPVRGFLSVSLYLLLGLIGLPVFAGHTAGWAVLTGPTGGYLFAFPVGAALAGFLVQHVFGARRTRAAFVFVAAMAGTAVIHLGGIIGFVVKLEMTWWEAVKLDGPYWVGDIIKAAIVAMVAAEVHRAFPRLLDRR